MHKYCETTTSEHSVSRQNPECRCSIKHLIEKEGGKGSLFKNDVVLNLDEIEKYLAHREKRKQRKTMDAFWGISESMRNKQVVLVDFKFRVGNPNSLTKNELEGKVRGSKDMIGFEIPVFEKYCFVFNSNIIQQAKSRFNRLFIGDGKLNYSYRAITEKELYDLYW